MEDDPLIVGTSVASLFFWLLLVAGVLIAGRRGRTRPFRDAMLRHWRAALVLGVLFELGMGLSGEGWLRRTTLVVVCEALIGFGLAEGIAGFCPLPVTRAIRDRNRVWAVLGVSLLVAVLLIALPIVAANCGSLVGGRIFGEQSLSGHTSELGLPSEPWRIFLMMLSGGGIAEETEFRLVVLCLAWRLTASRGWAIAISAVVFGLYHLSPIDSWYAVYWQAPITQLVTSTVGGLVMGYVFTRRGYETSVLGHTLGNAVLLSAVAKG